jgi:hypothetical protein
MTKTIKSFSDTRHYFLTIDDHSATAVDCSCPDRQYRHHECKHMSQFNAQMTRTTTFQQLWSALDYRSEANKAARREAYTVDFCIYA